MNYRISIKHGDQEYKAIWTETKLTETLLIKAMTAVIDNNETFSIKTSTGIIIFPPEVLKESIIKIETKN